MLHRDLHSLSAALAAALASAAALAYRTGLASVHTGGPLAAPDDHDDPPRLWRCDNVHGSGRERNR